MMPPSMNLNNTPESAKKRGGAVMMPPSMNLNNTPESAKKRGGAVMMPPNMNLNNIPERAKKECAFVIWKYQPRGNGVKPAKVPYNPKTSAPAYTADPSTFGGFSEVQNYAKARYDGVGVGIFRLSDGSCLAAIDIDHCIDENENLSPMADDIMKTMRAYTEVSPSGRGIRILFLLTPGFVFDSNKYYINNQAKGLEVYVAGATNKYVSVTGNTQTPGADLELRDAELLRVLEKYMVRPGQLVSQPAPQQAQPVAQDSGQPDNPLRPEDLALIESIKNGPSGEKFMALGQGDISIHYSIFPCVAGTPAPPIESKNKVAGILGLINWGGGD